MRQSKKKHFVSARWLNSRNIQGQMAETARQLQRMAQKTMMSSIFNYNTTHKLQLNQISEVVLFTQFHYMVRSNKSLPMLRISKTP